MPTRPVVAVLVLLACATGCGEKKNESQFFKQLKQTGNANASGGDSCGLLDTADVTKAIGTLAAPPYHGTFRPESGSSTCRYETTDHRRMLVSVDWSGGPEAMKMIGLGRSVTDQATKQGEEKTGQTVLSSGDTLVGAWDQIAQGPMSCCVLHVLKGDRHVELDWTGTRLTMAGAGALLNSGVQRLDHPLPIDGEAGIPAGQKLYAADAQDSAINMCTIVPQADAEAALGTKLLAAPTNGSAPGGNGLRECIYRVAGTGGMQTEYDLDLREWHDGILEFEQDQFAIGMGSRAMQRQITGTTTNTQSDTTNHPPGPWDIAGEPASPGVEAVKGPLLVRLGAMGNRPAMLALLGKAVTNLSAAH